MASDQRIGRVIGPNKGMKVLDSAGKDDQRHELVWVFCRDCLALKSIRWANAKNNATCGCGRDENVRQYTSSSIDRVPWKLRLSIWAAAQEKEGTANIWKEFDEELRPYRLEKFVRDQLIPTVFAALMKAQQHQRWTGRQAEDVVRLRYDLEHGIDRAEVHNGELDSLEYAKRKGEITGIYAEHVKSAKRIRSELGFLAPLDPKVSTALRRRGFTIGDDFALASWLIDEVKYTQSQRDKRRKRGVERAIGNHLAEKFSEMPDQEFIDATWSPESGVDSAD